MSHNRGDPGFFLGGGTPLSRASGRSRIKVKFRRIFRDKFAEKTADFAGISRDFSRPVSLKND